MCANFLIFHSIVASLDAAQDAKVAKNLTTWFKAIGAATGRPQMRSARQAGHEEGDREAGTPSSPLPWWGGLDE